jgi:hypothetical protein
MLKVGDIIYSRFSIGNQLTMDRSYTIVYTRNDGFGVDSFANHRPNLKSVLSTQEADICIRDDEGSNWWFGQIGSSEAWTRWFYSEKEWRRNKNLEDLGI